MRRFLEENETIILFAQGLVFFSLGFAVWIQRRRATRLRLTQSLIWLAAFAFVEALAVWGYVFVPLQEGYLGTGVIDVLLVVRAVLQTAAFLFLLEFGLRLIVDSRRHRQLWTGMAALAWVALLIVTGAIAANKGWTVGQWEASVEALARHMILLPAAVIAAVGLWRQRGELAEAGLRGIRPYAAAAAAVLLIYAVIGGMVVDLPFWSPGGPGPDVARFGAGAIQLAVARGLAGLVLSVLAVKLLEIFEFEAKARIEALDRRLGRGIHARIAVQPEVVVAREIDIRPSFHLREAARDAFMHAKEWILDLQATRAFAECRFTDLVPILHRALGELGVRPHQCAPRCRRPRPGKSRFLDASLFEPPEGGRECAGGTDARPGPTAGSDTAADRTARPGRRADRCRDRQSRAHRLVAGRSARSRLARRRRRTSPRHGRPCRRHSTGAA